jgi:hypothetical protein
MKFLLVIWLLCFTDLLGLLPHTETSETVLSGVCASIGVLLGAIGLSRLRQTWSRAQRLTALAATGVILFTLYACGVASLMWGSASVGELTRSLALGVFIYVATYPDQDSILSLFSTALRWCAYACSVAILVHVAAGVYPPGYEPVVPGTPFEGLHIAPSTILMTAIASELLAARRLHLGRVALFVIAQAFEGHASLGASAVIILVVAWLQRRAWRRRRDEVASSPRRSLGWTGAAWAAAVVATSGVMLSQQGSIFEKIMQTDMMTSRLAASTKRLDDIRDHFWFGVGLPGRTSRIAIDYADDAVSRFTETVRIADFGYIDLMLRYGALGTAPYIALWLYSAAFVWRRASSWRGSVYPTLVASFVFVNISLSVFSTSPGLFALLTTLCLTSRHCDDLSDSRSDGDG